MRHGLHRFTHFLKSAENLLQQANQQPNPSLWLLKNNGRTPFFMLEALAKLYEAFHHKKIFKKLRENHFKIIEDGLGQLDYYDFYISEFENIITVPRTAITYIKDQFQKKSTELNELLLKKGWIGEHNNRIAKIHKKLDAVDWKKEKKEVKFLLNYYDDEIKEIIDFYKKSDSPFTQLEEQVHELRRKLRWLSIYPQALLGCVQYTRSGHPPENLNKYFTEEIIHSPYNVFPEAGENRHFLLLEKNNFLALSWMINELGKEKDKGLGLYLLAEALEQTEKTDSNYAMVRAGEILLGNAKARDQILQNCHSICNAYFKEGSLQQLVQGIAVARA